MNFSQFVCALERNVEHNGLWERKKKESQKYYIDPGLGSHYYWDFGNDNGSDCIYQSRK